MLGLLGLGSCSSKGKVDTKNLGVKLDTMYQMRTLDVNTLVSDSGYTKARIVAPLWLIYSLENRKEWFFPKGLRMERYDSVTTKQPAFIVADTATYQTENGLWILSGHVRLHGMEGERLYTPKLYWEQKNRRVYSYDTTYFYTKGRELRGASFEAKDDLSTYTIRNNRGVFEYEEDGANPSTSIEQTAQPTTSPTASESASLPTSPAHKGTSPTNSSATEGKTAPPTSPKGKEANPQATKTR